MQFTNKVKGLLYNILCLFFHKAAQAIAGVFICSLGMLFIDGFPMIYTLPSVLVNIILKKLKMSI